MSSLKHNNIGHAYDYFDESNISSKQYEAFITLLRDEKIIIQKIKDIHFRTDDGFTQGFVKFDVQGEHAKQEVVVVINTSHMKLSVIDIKLSHFIDGDVTFVEAFIKKLRPLIITSNPG
jgi:DUF917 family protein